MHRTSEGFRKQLIQYPAKYAFSHEWTLKNKERWETVEMIRGGDGWCFGIGNAANIRYEIARKKRVPFSRHEYKSLTIRWGK